MPQLRVVMTLCRPRVCSDSQRRIRSVTDGWVLAGGGHNASGSAGAAGTTLSGGDAHLVPHAPSVRMCPMRRLHCGGENVKVGPRARERTSPSSKTHPIGGRAPWVRRATPADTACCWRIFQEAVSRGTRGHYDEAQRAAWCSGDDDGHWFSERISKTTAFVAGVERDPSGFLCLCPDDHLDLFYILPEMQRSAIAPALYEAMVDHTRALGIAELTTHASMLARRFLEKRGWHIRCAETVFRGGVALPRWRMALVMTEVPGTLPTR